MLSQNFKSAADLGISEKQKDALAKTLVLLETKALSFARNFDFKGAPAGYTGHFNMATWCSSHTCGTIACIGGTAELVRGAKFSDTNLNPPLADLFEPRTIHWRNWRYITPSQAATALRSYLTIGDARWDLAVQSSPEATADE